jgi:hypothetical protein
VAIVAERYKDQRTDDSSPMTQELAGIQSQIDELRMQLEAADLKKRGLVRAVEAAPKKASA